MFEMEPQHGNKANVTFFMISDFPSQQKLLPPPALNPSPNTKHRLVHNEGYKYRLCVHCQFNKIKTKSGWRVYTHFKCEKCNVPLCTQKRDCFLLYHKLIAEGSQNFVTDPLPQNTSSAMSTPLTATQTFDTNLRSGGHTSSSKPAAVLNRSLSNNSLLFSSAQQRFPPYPYASEFPFKYPPGT